MHFIPRPLVQWFYRERQLGDEGDHNAHVMAFIHRRMWMSER